jgi:hypothetical protein
MNGRPRVQCPRFFHESFTNTCGVRANTPLRPVRKSADENLTPASARRHARGPWRLCETLVAYSNCRDGVLRRRKFDTAEELYVRLARPNDVGAGKGLIDEYTRQRSRLVDGRHRATRALVVVRFIATHKTCVTSAHFHRQGRHVLYASKWKSNRPHFRLVAPRLTLEDTAVCIHE